MSKYAEDRKKFVPARTTRSICLNGSLQAEYEEAERRLQTAARDVNNDAKSFADRNPLRPIAEEVEAIRERMEGSTVDYVFQALSSKAYSDLELAHPPRPDVNEQWNQDTFVPALIQRCCVDPDSPPAEALDHPYFENVDECREFCVMLSQGQLDELFDGAYRINRRKVDVPFSVLASRTLQPSEQS